MRSDSIQSARGFSLLGVIAALFISTVVLAVLAATYTQANKQQKVTTLVQQITQVQQSVHDLYQGAPDFTGLTYAALLTQNKIPTAWQTSASTTQGVTPFGAILVGTTPYPGGPAGAADLARITISVGEMGACMGIIQALAPNSAQFAESGTGTTIAAIRTAASAPRDVSALASQASAVCKQAITSYGKATLTYDFI